MGSRLRYLLVLGLLIVVQSSPSFGQSQAIDAQIEGTVTDPGGSVIPGVSLTAQNIDNGTTRTTASNETGIYRFPLLTLGTYIVTAEYAGFKRFRRDGILLSAGQTASIPIILAPGNPDETVIVTSDAAIADASKFEVGRTLSSREVKNLPLVSRNPFNFILLQPGTTGRSIGTPAVINLSSNGLLRRVGYQLDGSYINEADVGGFRLVFIAETFVKEVQLLSSGYSAEFGDTSGTVVNFVTPSGTNNLDGTLALLFRPAVLSAKPFGFTGNGQNPNLNGHVFIGTVGGPIIKDRWHFFAGYERSRHNVQQMITITPQNRALLIEAGVPAATVQDPTAEDTLPYLIFRTDLEFSSSTRIALRYNRMDNDLRNALSFGLGSINTTERSFDFTGWDHAIAGQAVTSVSETFFNEFRFQRAERISGSVANGSTGSGPSISIQGVANLGPPLSIGVLGTNQSMMELRNTVTRVFDRHLLKVGGGINFIRDTELLASSAQYVFSSVPAYRMAVTGENTRSYSQYVESFGDPRLPMNVVFANLFVQDEWNVTRKLKVSAGLRYDLYTPPAAEPDSPLPFSRKFNTDTNNFGPRLGIAYLLRDGKYRTVVRGGGGVHYDPPFLRFYRGATQNNGNPRFFSYGFGPNDDRAPDFPNTLGSFPSGVDPLNRSVDAVAPDLKTMYAVHGNAQVEQALSEDMSITVGYLHSFARHIVVTRNINCLPTGETLADGRPKYGTTTTPCISRVYPQFSRVMMAESVGNLTYDGLFLQLNKRFSGGYLLGASYTYSTARDDAPEEVPGALSASDPSNRGRDRGPSAGDVRHVFRMSTITRPVLRTSNGLVSALLNGYQIGVIVFADSGENQNIVTRADLNGDGVFGQTGPDRPVGIPRNSLRHPAFFSVDMRLSRSFGLNESMSFEIYSEATNLFNSKSVSSYDTALPASLVDPATGILRAPLPDFSQGPTMWRPSRQVQIGLKLNF